MKTRIVSFGLAFALAACASRHQVAVRAAQPSVATTLVRVGSFDETVSAVGRVGGVSDGQAHLAFQVAGPIARIDVHVGDHVVAGEALAELDPRGFELAAGQSRSEEALAQADARAEAVDHYSTRIEVDKAALTREESLFKTGLSPRKDVLAAQAQLAQDEADARVANDRSEAGTAAVQTARLRAASAQRDLANTVLRAPSDGVVTEISRRAGESVDSTVPVITISENGPAAVMLDVAASDLQKIHPGDALHINIVGTDRSFAGTVAGVSNAVDPVTQMGRVAASWDGAQAPLGSILEARIVVRRVVGLIVPKSAIVEDPQTGNAVVFVAARGADGGEQFEQRVVGVAMHDDRSALLKSGVRPGESIAAQGGFTLLAPSDSGGD